ncbi:DNA-binding MarR family transcriptional regulator [Roseimicrobium gellanilyticum]|uniref:DNA-binding MarR family transcriptional regulator n=1 Tax=Roseimicrobium gellanilyticum TaxID=748857 RepID=A0A366H2B2_9BACT|nr:MarR family transcriptional regulator [Roseimicrobium gellanilyticum]RBP35181.1 DNA-binding MarR family transcriptional regulator [Roseimicrobium gellanilyticum]
MSNQFSSSTQGVAESREHEAILESLPIHLARMYHGFVALVDRLRGEDAGELPHFRPGAGSVYFALLENEGCTATDLAMRLGMPKPTVTGLLDGLERDGVIERRPCAEDGRAMKLRLTKFGLKLENGLRCRHEQSVRTLEEGLSHAEAMELRRLLSVVIGNLDRVRNTKTVKSTPVRTPRRARKAA